LFASWCALVESKASLYLKECVLARTNKTKEVTKPGASNALPPTSDDALEFDGLKVNFRADLKEMIRETKFLEKMGFSLPETAINIALQEDKYMTYVEILEKMLFDYHQILDSMDEAEKTLLQNHIKDVKRVISPGLTRLNWNSLGITDYVNRCNLEINRLVTILNHVQKNSNAISAIIEEISRAVLVKIEKSQEPIEANVRASLVRPFYLTIQDFFESLNNQRTTITE
jgi:dynein heavy chain